MIPSTSFLLLALLLPNIIRGQPTIHFTDVTEQVGVSPFPDRFKYGGPCVADLDGDGIYDLILSYHASARIDVFWGQPNGTFVRDPFIEMGDIHGITVALHTTSSQTRIISINKGGARGANLTPPFMYLVDRERKFVNVTDSLGLGRRGSRGRVSMFMDLSLRDDSTRRTTQSGPDFLVVGFAGPGENISQFAYENNGGSYSLRDPGEFSSFTESRVEVADVDGDGKLEVLNFPRLRIFKLVAPFTLVEDTEAIFNSTNNANYMTRTTAAIAEFDLNNRGRFDLYIARAPLIDVIPPTGGLPGLPFSDLLFKRHRKRGLIDISSKAGVPNDTRSMSVVAGDFDNNGFVDLFVPVFIGSDFFLMNNGNQTFTRIDSMIPKEDGVPGGHAVAADYDRDGRLDLIVGQGGQVSDGGPSRIMRNTLPRAMIGNYLLVRVGIEPRRRTSPLHAVVLVRVGGMRLLRRVGGSGAQSGGPSYLDTVHFGLGSFSKIDSVAVRYVDGSRSALYEVQTNQKVTIGIVD